MASRNLAAAGNRLIDLGRAAARFDTRSLCVLEEVVSAHEEKALIAECETVLRRRRYVNDGHWDGVIERYKEVERPAWQDENEKVLERMRRLLMAETSVSTPFLPVHIIDLAADGYIRPHVDSVKFSGELVAGLSLLSSSIMRLTAEDNPDSVVDLLLEPRSLYLLRGEARYKYAHEILPDAAIFNRSGQCVARSRRISLIFRDQVVSDSNELCSTGKE